MPSRIGNWGKRSPLCFLIELQDRLIPKAFSNLSNKEPTEILNTKCTNNNDQACLNKSIVWYTLTDCERKFQISPQCQLFDYMFLDMVWTIDALIQMHPNSSPSKMDKELLQKDIPENDDEIKDGRWFFLEGSLADDLPCGRSIFNTVWPAASTASERFSLKLASFKSLLLSGDVPVGVTTRLARVISTVSKDFVSGYVQLPLERHSSGLLTTDVL